MTGRSLSVDVVIVGAGLSGIGAACHLIERRPEKSFVILEGRERMGGTWDLFRYPGVRSDSDMYTLGYRFRPWSDAQAIADGPAILRYIRETAEEYKIEDRILYRHRARRAEWSSSDAAWTLEVDTPEGVKDVSCKFLYLCTGYYAYESGYTPEWPGMSDFAGPVIHPQFWPADLDPSGKRIVVIGSGATAVTLVPALAESARHVTMLQRTPTYIVARPRHDKIANLLRRVLPSRAAYMLTRWKNVLVGMAFYELSRKRPDIVKRLIARGVRRHLGESVDPADFSPPYNPWDQRLCLVPDADLFGAIRMGRASIVTGHIERFRAGGIVLESGAEIAADVVVTATGLRLKLLEGLTLVVDGRAVDLSQKLAYKGMMYSDVPNLAQAFGYTNASWTLKCDLTSEYVCRILAEMDRGKYEICTPRVNDPTIRREPVLDFNSGYVLRALDELPSQGSKPPWRLYQNYVRDLLMLRFGRIKDGTLEFKRRSEMAPRSVEHETA
ncbi:MAG: flavin-containing monooxygenase [Pyrinomonadaceae bacterium]